MTNAIGPTAQRNDDTQKGSKLGFLGTWIMIQLVSRLGGHFMCVHKLRALLYFLSWAQSVFTLSVILDLDLDLAFTDSYSRGEAESLVWSERRKGA